MQSKSAALQDQINELDLLIQQGASDAQLNIWEMQRKELRDQLQVALAEEVQQQERIDAQAEKIETITLAYDYNEILGNPMANETIIENVKQFQLQAYEEHNAEVARINAEWATKVKNEQDSYADLLGRHKKQADYLNEIEVELEEKKEDNYKQHEQINQLSFEKREAETTRDNAARLLEEANENFEATKELNRALSQSNADLQGQIEALKQELTAKKALTVSGNEKLAELAAKAKESTAAAAARGIERWNQQYGMDIPTLSEPDVLPVNDVVLKDEAAEIQPFQEVETPDNAGLQNDQGNSIMESVVSEESEVVTRAEHEALKLNLGAVSDELESVKKFIGMAA